MGPIVGALFGAFIYDAFLFTGDESILNRPYVHVVIYCLCELLRPFLNSHRNAKAKLAHIHAEHEQRRHMPAGPGVDDIV